MKPKKPLYKSELGACYCADALAFLPTLPAGSVDLIVTSPPYALHFKKEYERGPARIR
jgi:site-specific DNA-methyltransferase (cytosine-N4-specific)